MPSSMELRALEVITACAERGEPLFSYAELAAAIGLSSRSRISELIARLEKEGLIEVRRTTTGRVRTATIRPAGLRPTRTVPVLGRVAAGVPILAQTDDLVDLVSLPANRARGAEVYMLEVKGESMTGDGILDGDHVVVVVDPRPAQGSVAVVHRRGSDRQARLLRALRPPPEVLEPGLPQPGLRPGRQPGRPGPRHRRGPLAFPLRLE